MAYLQTGFTSQLSTKFGCVPFSDLHVNMLAMTNMQNLQRVGENEPHDLSHLILAFKIIKCWENVGNSMYF